MTWEGLEHSGPGLYDMEYIEYIRKVVLIANDFNISVYLDPHQDVWSRWTGNKLFNFATDLLNFIADLLNFKADLLILWPIN